MYTQGTKNTTERSIARICISFMTKNPRQFTNKEDAVVRPLSNYQALLRYEIDIAPGIITYVCVVSVSV